MAKDTCESGRALPGYDTALWAILQVRNSISIFCSILIVDVGGESPMTISGLVLFMDVYFPCGKTLRISTTKLSIPKTRRLH